MSSDNQYPIKYIQFRLSNDAGPSVSSLICMCYVKNTYIYLYDNEIICNNPQVIKPEVHLVVDTQ